MEGRRRLGGGNVIADLGEPRVLAARGKTGARGGE
jgi:hypothetical protein